MGEAQFIQAKDFNEYKIKIHEPFAQFLLADPDEYEFSISLLDVVRFAGHACPAMVGAFLMSQKAVKELFPKTNICVRGQVGIEMPSSVEQGATGPISNVFSMIFGSWEKSGFGGLQGQFVRRGLLKYDVAEVPRGTFRFRNIETGETVDITYDPSTAEVPAELQNGPFQKIWRKKIEIILKNPNAFVKSHKQEAP